MCRRDEQGKTRFTRRGETIRYLTSIHTRGCKRLTTILLGHEFRVVCSCLHLFGKPIYIALWACNSRVSGEKMDYIYTFYEWILECI